MTGPVTRIPHPVQVALLAVVYFSTAKASLMLAIPPGYATAVWPPSGIALAALLMFGTRVWAGVWLGAAAVNITVASSLFAAVAIGTGNTLEAVAGAALVRRYIASEPPHFARARNVVKFVAFAVLCPTLAATTGTLAITLEGAVQWNDFVQNWWTWWHGDAAGIIIVTPLLLTWNLRHDVIWSRAKQLEAAGFTFSLLLGTYAIFSDGFELLSSLPLTFMILPLIIWAAFRFSRREVMTASTVICSIAVWNTIEGRGPFAVRSLNESLLLLLAFISTVVTTGLILSAAVAERARALSRLGQALSALQEQASTDPLTGLHNRRHLWDFLRREWIRARRRDNSLAVIMIDLDHFKQVNDTFGHSAGDRVLMEVAELLKGQIRGSDIACRFGGEEFTLTLPDARLDGAQRRANDIREAIRRLEPEHGGRPLGRITASFGIALFPDHAGDPESLLRAADEALYRAKSTGRDRVVVSSEHWTRAKPDRGIASA